LINKILFNYKRSSLSGHRRLWRHPFPSGQGDSSAIWLHHSPEFHLAMIASNFFLCHILCQGCCQALALPIRCLYSSTLLVDILRVRHRSEPCTDKFSSPIRLVRRLYEHVRCFCYGFMHCPRQSCSVYWQMKGIFVRFSKGRKIIDIRGSVFTAVPICVTLFRLQYHWGFLYSNWPSSNASWKASRLNSSVPHVSKSHRFSAFVIFLQSRDPNPLVFELPTISVATGRNFSLCQILVHWCRLFLGSSRCFTKSSAMTAQGLYQQRMGMTSVCGNHCRLFSKAELPYWRHKLSWPMVQMTRTSEIFCCPVKPVLLFSNLLIRRCFSYQ